MFLFVLNERMTKLQGRPFFVVIRCTLPSRNPKSPSVGTGKH